MQDHSPGAASAASLCLGWHSLHPGSPAPTWRCRSFSSRCCRSRSLRSALACSRAALRSARSALALHGQVGRDVVRPALGLTAWCHSAAAHAACISQSREQNKAAKGGPHFSARSRSARSRSAFSRSCCSRRARASSCRSCSMRACAEVSTGKRSKGVCSALWFSRHVARLAHGVQHAQRASSGSGGQPQGAAAHGVPCCVACLLRLLARQLAAGLAHHVPHNRHLVACREQTRHQFRAAWLGSNNAEGIFVAVGDGRSRKPPPDATASSHC